VGGQIKGQCERNLLSYYCTSKIVNKKDLTSVEKKFQKKKKDLQEICYFATLSFSSLILYHPVFMTVRSICVYNL
jgi:hypothetical protein